MTSVVRELLLDTSHQCRIGQQRADFARRGAFTTGALRLFLQPQRLGSVAAESNSASAASSLQIGCQLQPIVRRRVSAGIALATTQRDCRCPATYEAASHPRGRRPSVALAVVARVPEDHNPREQRSLRARHAPHARSLRLQSRSGHPMARPYCSRSPRSLGSPMSSSGVHRMGGRYPWIRHARSSRGRSSALAIWRRFHVIR